MTETLLIYLTDYGAILLLVATYLSCLAVPIPTSLMMLSGGAFVASGDLDAVTVITLALTGAIAGDNTGYLIGGRARDRIQRFMKSNPKREKLLSKAESTIEQRGMTGIFLSRWLFSPLGPYVNFTAGAAAMRWGPFFIAGVLGEITWVSIYVGLGYTFADNLTVAANLASNALGIMAGGMVMIGTGAWLYNNHRKESALANG